MDEEEAVAEVDRHERERRRYERHAEAIHLAEERPRELQAELHPVDAEKCEVDEQRAGEVAGDHAHRALFETDDEEDRCADRQADVREARQHELGRALLGPEERGELLVVHLCPDRDRARANEVRVVQPEQVGELRCEQHAGGQSGRRRSHREPKARPHDEKPTVELLRVEVEAEERGRDAEAQDRDGDGGDGDDDSDGAEVGRVEVARVEREEKERENARDDPADPVDGGVTAEAAKLRAERHLSRGSSGSQLCGRRCGRGARRS